MEKSLKDRLYHNSFSKFHLPFLSRFCREYTALYLLSEQSSPPKPFKQSHVKDATPSLQVPLFWHGMEAQSSISVNTQKALEKLFYVIKFLRGKLVPVLTFWAGVTGETIGTVAKERCAIILTNSVILARVGIAVVNVCKIYKEFSRNDIIAFQLYY